MSSHSSYASYRANKSRCSTSGEAGAQGPQGSQGPRGVDSAGTMKMKYGGVGTEPLLSTFMFDNSDNTLVSQIALHAFDIEEINMKNWINTWAGNNGGLGTLQIFKEIAGTNPILS